MWLIICNTYIIMWWLVKSQENSIWIVWVCMQQDRNCWKWCFQCSLHKSCIVRAPLYRWKMIAENYCFPQSNHKKSSPFSHHRGSISKHINGSAEKNMVLNPNGAWNQRLIVLTKVSNKLLLHFSQDSHELWIEIYSQWLFMNCWPQKWRKLHCLGHYQATSSEDSRLRRLSVLYYYG